MNRVVRIHGRTRSVNVNGVEKSLSQKTMVMNSVRKVAMNLTTDDRTMSMLDILDYEIRSSWWVSRVGSQWGQKLTAKYIAWKVKRKYDRYVRSRKFGRSYRTTCTSEYRPRHQQIHKRKQGVAHLSILQVFTIVRRTTTRYDWWLETAKGNLVLQLLRWLGDTHSPRWIGNIHYQWRLLEAAENRVDEKGDDEKGDDLCV